MWLQGKANEVRDAWEHLSHKKIVGVLFYAASAFADFEGPFHFWAILFRAFTYPGRLPR